MNLPDKRGLMPQISVNGTDVYHLMLILPIFSGFLDCPFTIKIRWYAFSGDYTQKLMEGGQILQNIIIATGTDVGVSIMRCIPIIWGKRSKVVVARMYDFLYNDEAMKIRCILVLLVGKIETTVSRFFIAKMYTFL